MRRKKFWKVMTREEALALFADLPPVEEETVEIARALGRVVAREVNSPVDVPHFPRATMDGFAVKAKDTYGASETMPRELRVVGEVAIGTEAREPISEGEASEVATGSMVPPGADAVLMMEYAASYGGHTILVQRPVAPGENISPVGGDIRKGARVLRRGRFIRPQDIGALASVGLAKCSVFRVPRVGILSTGDELVPVETEPGPAQVRGINCFTLSALTIQYGACPVDFGTVRDSARQIRESLERAIASTDLTAIAGGSSVGTQDLTLEVIQSFDNARILAHGLAIRPGKPTILARVGNKPVIGLPGHPVSAIIVFSILAKTIIHRLVSYSDELYSHRGVRARISRNVASASGREDYLRVSLVTENGQLVAQPLPGESGAISTLIQADGLVRIPLEKEGLEAGEIVEVELF